MIATGPRPPLSFNSSNDESPVKLDIGGGMGEQTSLCMYLRTKLFDALYSICKRFDAAYLCSAEVGGEV